MQDAEHRDDVIYSRLLEPLERSDLFLDGRVGSLSAEIHAVAQELDISPRNVMGRLEKMVRASEVLDAVSQDRLANGLHEKRTARA